MTDAQWAALWQLLLPRAPGDFHEGDCIGSDEQAAFAARSAGFRIIGHPPTNDKLRAFFPADEWRAPAPYMVRNRDIVVSTEEMIATPAEFVEKRTGGTWSTIRYARSLGRACHVILPDGTVQGQA